MVARETTQPTQRIECDVASAALVSAPPAHWAVVDAGCPKAWALGMAQRRIEWTTEAHCQSYAAEQRCVRESIAADVPSELLERDYPAAIRGALGTSALAVEWSAIADAVYHEVVASWRGGGNETDMQAAADRAAKEMCIDG